MDEELMEVLGKVFKKQRYISSDEDLAVFGYVRQGLKSGKQCWGLKEISDARNKINNPINNPIYNRENNPRRINFKGRGIIALDEPMPDNERCMICGIENDAHKLLTGKRLSYHHDLYSEDEPLRYTRIVCSRCHAELHWEERRTVED